MGLACYVMANLFYGSADKHCIVSGGFLTLKLI